MQGYGIAQRLRDLSDDVLAVGESSLYPALRLLLNDYVHAEWGASENNRRARYYTLTPVDRGVETGLQCEPSSPSSQGAEPQ